MKVLTKYFGEVQIDPDTTLRFPEGLYGFENEKEFVLLPYSDEDGFLLCLQSTNTPELAFSLINPFMLKPDYKPVLNKKELDMMEVNISEELCYYVTCKLKKPISESTVNLKCPIVINDKTRQARQFILDEYDMRVMLSSLEK